MYPLGPWGFAQVLNQYQYHVGVEQSYSDNVLTARNKKGTYNKIPPMEIIVIIIPEVSAVQFNILDIYIFFPAVILTLHTGQGRQLTSRYKSQSQPFSQLSQAQNI